MLTLLDEILRDVLITLPDGEKSEICDKNVENFMLSGKEPFEIAKNYFMQANKICIKPKCFKVFVKEKQWIFSYNFLFASIFSKIIAAQKIKIEFSQKSVMLDNLLINGLTEVHIFGDIHEKYLDRFHSLSSLTNLEFQRCKIRFQDLILFRPIPSKLCPIIDYQEMIKENTLNMLFPNVQHLAIRGRFVSSDITFDSLKRFHNNIFTIFPQLQKLSVYYTTVNSSWQDIFSIMNEITPDIFGNIFTNAIGEIRFDYSEWNVLLSEVTEKINEKMNVEIERNESTLKRSIQKNADLCFTFSLYFRRTERQRRRFK